jgi:hypothetical protein
MWRGRPRGRGRAGGRAGGRARPHVGPDIDHYFRPPPVLEPQVVLQPARPVLPPPVLQPILPPPVLPHHIPARFSQQRIETYLSDTESEAGHSGIISLYDVRALKNVLT